MISLKKLLYTVPETLEIIFKETGKQLDYLDLFPFARDGNLYFSFLAEEEHFIKCLQAHWDKQRSASGGKTFPDSFSEYANTVLGKGERHVSGRIIAYVPPGNDFFMKRDYYLSAGVLNKAIAIYDVILEPRPEAVEIEYAHGIDLFGIQAAFMGAFCTDSDVYWPADQYSPWFHEAIKDVRVEELNVTKSQLESFLSYLDDEDGADGKKEPFAKRWEDVTIKLLAHHRIALECGEKSVHTSLHELGLIDKRDNKTPTKAGAVLIGLAKDKNYPRNVRATESEKQDMKKLRKALREITEIEKNPFTQPDTTSGWKPRFKLIDGTRRADLRAMQRARFETYDYNRAYYYKPGEELLDDNDT
jgi:hypothetical protein